MTKKYIILILGFCLCWQKSFADTLPLTTILTQFEHQYQVFFSYDFEEIKPIQIDFEFISDESKESAIERLLKQCNWDYESFDNKYFVLFKKEQSVSKIANNSKRDKSSTVWNNQLVNRQLFAMLVDEATQAPIYNAFVFIRNSSISATSDISGVFQLDIGRLTKVELVITHLNYKTKTIKINTNSQLPQTISLKAKNVEIAQILVKGKRANSRKRKAWMKQFKVAFFGTTSNSKGIEFENPEVLWFEEKDKVVKAHAVDYLSIKNTVLGYTMRFYLDTFQMKKRGKVIYAGKVFFEDKLAATPNQKRIKINRQRTFQGSKKYFFRNLWKAQVDEEQYILGLATFDKKGGLADFKQQKLADFTTKRQGDWFIIYTNQQFTFANMNIVTKWGSGFFKGGKDTYATGYLKPLNGRIIIDQNGAIINANEIEESGYWAKQRIANLLPIEYQGGSDFLVDKANQKRRQLNRLVQQVNEKIYLHLDKPYYSISDEIRFKSYLVNANNHSFQTASKVVYVDLISPQNKVVKSWMLHTEKGLEGMVNLAKQFPAGKYILRAYTKYMQNFAPTHFFEKEIQLFDNESISKNKTAAAILANHQVPPNTLDNSSPINVKFYPEGGDLVTSVNGNIAFEVLDKKGMPLDIIGEIQTDNDLVVSKIKTTHQGIGLFNLKPQLGEKYKAIIPYKGQTLEFPLTSPKKNGYVLKLNNTDDENLYLDVATNNLENLIGAFLIGHVRGQVFCLLREDDLTQILTIPKASIPIGLATFTLFNEAGQPQAERLIFNDFGINQLAIDWPTTQEKYGKRSQINIDLKLPIMLEDTLNNSFSVSVTDQSIVRYPASASTIQSYLWLNSDLLNSIPNAASYLTDVNKEKRFLLDLLVMTKKWRRFNWQDLATSSDTLKHAPELGYTISGFTTELETMIKTPSRVTLTALNQDFYTQTTDTDKNGHFSFTNIPFADSLNFILQARKLGKKDKSSTNKKGALIGDRALDIHLDTLPNTTVPTKSQFSNKVEDALILADFLAVTNQANLVDSVYKTDWSIDLDAVTVKARKSADSRLYGGYNFNKMDWINPETSGTRLLNKLKPRYNFIIDAGTGQIIRTTRNLRGEIIRINMKVYIDGIEVNSIRFSTTPVDLIDYLYIGDAVISMTTRKNGPRSLQAKLEQGILNISHPGYHQARTFYAPNYAKKLPVHEKPDYRTTIHWDSHLTFNKDGKAQLSFYTADSPGTYEIRLMGMAEHLPFFGKYTVVVE